MLLLLLLLLLIGTRFYRFGCSSGLNHRILPAGVGGVGGVPLVLMSQQLNSFCVEGAELQYVLAVIDVLG